MCASYMIKGRQTGRFPLNTEARIDVGEYYDELIVPYHPAPVLVGGAAGPVLTGMQFSMVPSWSKEPKVKFATHNARLDSIDEKPTWKSVFVRRHCLVPMSEFYEPIYDGEHAGYMVGFSQQNGEWFFAAGVWDEWVNRQTGEVIQSFAVITSDPPPYVAEIGHDRCPVFLTPDAGTEWLSNQGQEPKLLKQFLHDKHTTPEFAVNRQRPMRPGWEKRR